MIELHRRSERSRADHGWLRSYHSFSFADYYDPRHIGATPDAGDALKIAGESVVTFERGQACEVLLFDLA